MKRVTLNENDKDLFMNFKCANGNKIKMIKFITRVIKHV